MIEDCDEVCTVLSTRISTARKPHCCTECSRIIETGESYLSESCLFDGDFTIYKTCAHCRVTREWLEAECGGFVYQGIREDIDDHAREGYGFGVMRLAIGMRKKWRYGNASLMPIPKCPKVTAAHA
jgi:hypothetical protein